jgi:hypothetical protein
MVSLLNEEIRVIQTSMSHIKRAIPLAESSGERMRLEEKYKQLGLILEEKLANCGDFKG